MSFFTDIGYFGIALVAFLTISSFLVVVNLIAQRNSTYDDSATDELPSSIEDEDDDSDGS